MILFWVHKASLLSWVVCFNLGKLGDLMIGGLDIFDDSAKGFVSGTFLYRLIILLIVLRIYDWLWIIILYEIFTFSSFSISIELFSLIFLFYRFCFNNSILSTSLPYNSPSFLFFHRILILSKPIIFWQILNINTIMNYRIFIRTIKIIILIIKIIEINVCAYYTFLKVIVIVSRFVLDMGIFE